MIVAKNAQGSCFPESGCVGYPRLHQCFVAKDDATNFRVFENECYSKSAFCTEDNADSKCIYSKHFVIIIIVIINIYTVNFD